jgi:predicted dehydrogenase/nucleoside-diphosphate-sugar epimerase
MTTSGTEVIHLSVSNRPLVADGPVVRPVDAELVSVGVVGAGYIAGYHLAVLQQLKGVRVVAACDPNEERLSALCAEWKIPYGANSLQQLLQERKPDVVHVLVPPASHADVVEQALEAGIHVLVEKPMALQVGECERLIELARAKRLRLGVNHNAVYHPAFQRLLTEVTTGKLGKLEHVLSINNLPLAQLTSGEHDHWMFRSPENILFEQGPHPLSQICALLGPVREIMTVRSGEQVLRGGRRFSSQWEFTIGCARGTAQLFLSFGRPFPDVRLHVIGQDGTATVDLLANSCVLDRRTRYADPIDRFRRGLSQARQVAKGAIGEFLRYGLSTLRIVGRRDPYYLSMQGAIAAFYKTLRGEKAGGITAEDGRDVIDGLEHAAVAAGADVCTGGGDTGARRKPRESVPASARIDGATTSRIGEVLVLGGTGFIGRRLVAALAADHPVRVMVRRPGTASDLMEQGGLTVRAGDIRNAADVDRAVEGCGAVIHLVAGAPAGWREHERLFIDGTRNVADACLRWKVPQLLFVSSVTAYYLGRQGVTVTEESPLDDRPEKRCDYSRAKIACEQMLGEMHRSSGLPVTIFRPGIVVGPGGPVEHLGVGAWPNATHCVTWGKNVCRGLPFVLVDDVAAALVSALGRPGLEGKSFNLVGDVRMSAAEYVAALQAESQREVRIHPRSVWRWTILESLSWLIKAVARKPNNTRMTYRELAYRTLASDIDCRLAKQLLDWRPIADRAQFIELAIRRALPGISGI